MTGSAFSAGAASTVGGMVQLLPPVVCSGSQSQVRFSGIPQGYSDLLITFSGRSTGSAYTPAMWIKFNGDGNPANYASTERLYGDRTGTAQADMISPNASLGAFFAYSGGALNTTTPIVTGSILIPAYTQQTFARSFLANWGLNYHTTLGPHSAQTFGHWLSSANITTVEINHDTGGSFQDGFTFCIYGLGGPPAIRQTGITKLRNSVNQTISGTGVVYQTWDTVVYDLFNAWNAANNRIVIPYSGIYTLSYSFNPNNNGSVLVTPGFEVTSGGSTRYTWGPDPTVAAHGAFTFTDYFLAGDLVKACWYKNGAGSYTVLGFGDNYTFTCVGPL